MAVQVATAAVFVAGALVVAGQEAALLLLSQVGGPG